MPGLSHDVTLFERKPFSVKRTPSRGSRGVAANVFFPERSCIRVGPLRLFTQLFSWAILLATTVSVIGCGATLPHAAGAADSTGARPARSVPRSLLVYLPPRVDVVVALRPSVLFTDPSFSRLANLAFRGEALDAIRMTRGFDPRELYQVVIARVENEALFIVRGPFDAEAVARSAGDDMFPLDTSTDSPLRRGGVLRAGEQETRRWEFLAIEPDLLVATTSPQFASHVEAQWRASEIPPARADRLRELSQSLGLDQPDPPAVSWAIPDPLELDPSTSLGVLLAEERFMSGSLSCEGDVAKVHFAMRGTFPGSILENLSALAHSLADSDLLQSLRLSEAMQNVVVRIALSSDSRTVAQSMDPNPDEPGLEGTVTAEFAVALEDAEVAIRSIAHPLDMSTFWSQTNPPALPNSR